MSTQARLRARLFCSRNWRGQSRSQRWNMGVDKRVANMQRLIIVRVNSNSNQEVKYAGADDLITIDKAPYINTYPI